MVATTDFNVFVIQQPLLEPEKNKHKTPPSFPGLKGVWNQWVFEVGRIQREKGDFVVAKRVLDVKSHGKILVGTLWETNNIAGWNIPNFYQFLIGNTYSIRVHFPLLC